MLGRVEAGGKETMSHVYRIELLTLPAKDWVDRNIATEPWQWLGPTLVIEHRYIGPICIAMEDAGLVPERDWNVTDG